MGHEFTQVEPYWYWVDEQEVAAEQTPELLVKPAWQLTQKFELKQATQLAAQGRHLLEAESG
jgi:hypothetical protein